MGVPLAAYSREKVLPFVGVSSLNLGHFRQLKWLFFWLACHPSAPAFESSEPYPFPKNREL